MNDYKLIHKFKQESHLHVPPVLASPLQQNPSLSSSVRSGFQLLHNRNEFQEGGKKKKQFAK